MNKRLSLLLLFCVFGFWAKGQAPSQTYLKTMNSYVSGSPEAAQIMKYTDYPVNLFTGTPEISVPIYTLVGKGISVPINISYHAGGGVKVDEQSTNIGLSWAIDAGGEITREVRGKADEGGTGSPGFFNKPYPMSVFIDSFNCCIGNYTNQGMWVNAFSGLYDLEPDIFYFSFGGHSGKFIYDDSVQQFVCLTENDHTKISFDLNANIWTIVTDDGDKYTFSLRETSSSAIHNVGISANQTAVGPAQTTSWKLTKIVNADATDSIMLNYVPNSYMYYSEGSNITYQTLGGNSRNPVISYVENHIDGVTKLDNISGKSFSIYFVDETNNRLDLGSNQKALGKIIVKNNAGVVQDIFVLHHSYFNRLVSVGTMPSQAGTLINYSLKLDSISEYGNSETNAYPIRHAFSYDPQPLPARLSFAKDWWGYPNDNIYYTSSLVPPTPTANEQSQAGANRTPDTSLVHAGILTQVRLPTGGTVNYTYECNTTAVPVEQSLIDPNAVLSVAQVIREETQNDSQHFTDSTLEFDINVPPNAAINQSQGGVIADFTFAPAAPVQPPGYGDLAAYPSYTLDKTSELPGQGSTGPLNDFHIDLQSTEYYQIHLPNGHYVMKLHRNNYNQNLPIIPVGEGDPTARMIFFSVAYDILDTSGMVINYSCGGVRVKSIVSKDQFSNVTKTRNFIYNNPVNDSSYGNFIGSSIHVFYEATNTGGNQQWEVRLGSFNLPGMGNVISNIIYPKVIEDVSDNGVVSRTEHYYTAHSFPWYGGSWPFTPAIDVESGRGSEYLTSYDQKYGSNFIPAAINQKVFNFTPSSNSNPNAGFSKFIYGIRCACSSYDDAWLSTSGYAPPFVMPYMIPVQNRLYLTSDSTTTYDPNNQNHYITEWHDYTYGDNNQKPIIERSGNSDGSINITKTYYPMDQPDINSNINAGSASQMVTANRVTIPLGTKQYKDGNLLSQEYTYAHLSSGKLLVDSSLVALFNNPLDVEMNVLQYDAFANPLLVQLRGNKYRRYIWNNDRGLPLATCVSSQTDTFYFTSFEYPSDGGTAGTAFSGTYAYQLTNANTLHVSGTTNNSDVYVWATGNSFTINGAAPVSTGKTKGTWTLYSTHLSGGNGITIAGNALLDQLVLLPAGSQFMGKVYDGLNRVIAVVNDQINTNFYEYDNYGRLTTIRDEKGNILKSDSYLYQAPE
jgi:YD repeat-containing protein